MASKTTKRAAHGAGNVRKRPDGRWEGRITIGRDPGTGKQKRRSVYADTQAEVVKQLRELQADIDKGTYTEPIKLTVSEWLDIWLKDYTGNLKPRTLSLYKGQINYRIKPALGAVKLQALKPHQIQAFYNSLLICDTPLAPKTIKNLHGMLHKALQQAVEVDYLKNNPTMGCKLPRVEKAELRALNDDELTTFLTAIEGHRYQVFYTTTLFTGMRRGELMGLTWDCINFETGTIRIYRQLQLFKGGIYRFGSLKNDKERTVTPATFVMQALKQHKQLQIEWQLRAGSAWLNKEGFVFTDEIGQHYRQKTFYVDFKKILSDNHIPDMRFHDLRHSYAVASLRAGDDIKILQENMGHHSAAFTMDTYAHITEQMKKDSAQKMDNYINTVKKA